jgi:hypothetical protein
MLNVIQSSFCEQLFLTVQQFVYSLVTKGDRTLFHSDTTSRSQGEEGLYTALKVYWLSIYSSDVESEEMPTEKEKVMCMLCKIPQMNIPLIASKYSLTSC